MLLEYIAGYFDADGSVRAYMQTKTVEVGVEITAVYLPVLQEIQKQFGGTIRMKSDTKGACGTGLLQDKREETF